MKHYDNFDNNVFIKIICVISALALIFVIVVATVGLLTEDAPAKSNGGEAETFSFGNTDTDPDVNIELLPENTEEESTTEAPSTDAPAERETEQITESETEEIIENIPTPTVLGKTEDMGQEYIDSLTFLGDSTTYGLKAYKMLSGGKNTEQVWTSKTATVSLVDILTKTIVYPKTGKEMSIPEAAEKSKPEYLVITLGVEGVTTLGEEDFKEQYSSLVKAVKAASPDTKIILQSIFPVASSYTEKNKLNNPIIDKANGWVLEIAENENVKYLDTASVLKDESGALNPKYDNGGNGINLNDIGFDAVLQYIRTHAYK